jgi:hypothetical protein
MIERPRASEHTPVLGVPIVVCDLLFQTPGRGAERGAGDTRDLSSVGRMEGAPTPGSTLGKSWIGSNPPPL